MIIRTVTLDDAKGICDIYNYYVENTAVTFETVAVSESEMQQRIKGFLDAGFPYYVVEINGKIAGYCYLHNWNNRCAYSSTKEVTIYLETPKRKRTWYNLVSASFQRNI
ncbi:MAG: N-acetyltransferase family protein [Bacteroides graminisolvens]